MNTQQLYRARKTVRAIDKGVDTLLLACAVLVVIVAAFHYWDTNRIFSEGDAATYAEFKPTIDDTKSFEELQEINPDVIAWVTVYGTKIDHPVVQGKNNVEYLNKDVFGRTSLGGAIFLDSQNNPDFEDYNSIIHGHHMQESAMFGNLDLFVDEEFFLSRKYGNLFFNGDDHGLEFFIFVETTGYDFDVFKTGVAYGAPAQAYLADLYTKAIWTRDIGIQPDDQIVLLATCTSDLDNRRTNGRHILVARLTDEVFENTFLEEEPEPTVFEWSRGLLDGQMVPFCFTLLMLLALLIVLWTKQQKKIKEQQQRQVDAATKGENDAQV